MNHLVVVADLEKLRAFRLTPADGYGRRASIEEIPTELAPQKPSPTNVTDRGGRFLKGGGPNGTTLQQGEAHGRAQEDERRSLETVTSAVAAIVDSESFESWNLAAPARICPRLVDGLAPGLKKHLKKIVSADLTGLPLKEIERQFL